MGTTEIATEIVTDYHEQIQQGFKEGLYGGLLDGFSMFLRPEILGMILLLVGICILFKLLERIVKNRRNGKN